MMRTPTPRGEIYRWHRRYMLGLEPELHDGWPEAGWYKARLVKGGPFVPVEIWLDQVIDPETGELAEDELLFCTVNGIAKDPKRIWTYLRPISREEFAAMTGGAAGAGQADPMKKVNLMKKAISPNG